MPARSGVFTMLLGDMDLDGDLDYFLNRHNRRRMEVFENVGGSFEQINRKGHDRSGIWDNRGVPDLFVVTGDRGADGQPPATTRPEGGPAVRVNTQMPNQLYDGDGSVPFVDVGLGLGLVLPGIFGDGSGAIFTPTTLQIVDFDRDGDNDGWIDIVLMGLSRALLRNVSKGANTLLEMSPTLPLGSIVRA